MHPSDDIFRRIKTLESTVARLSRSPRLTSSSQKGGTNKLYAADGTTVLFEFGEFTDPFEETRYGLNINDGLGVPAMVVDELQKGRVYPGEHHQWSVQAAQSVASGTYANIASTEIQLPPLPVIVAQARVTTPASTTAEVRIAELDGASVATTAVTVPAASDGIVRFVWEHPYTTGWDYDPDFPDTIDAVTRLHWQVRRASGAGTISAYPPWNFYFVSNRAVRDEATTGGGTFVVNGSGVW